MFNITYVIRKENRYMLLKIFKKYLVWPAI